MDEQIFIKVMNKKGNMVDRDIRDTTGWQRLEWYNTQTKTELAIIIENLIKKELR